MGDVSQPPDRSAQLVFAVVGGVMLLSLLFYALLTVTRIQLAQPADASALEAPPAATQTETRSTPVASNPSLGDRQFEAHCARSDPNTMEEPFIVRASSVPSPTATAVVAVAVITGSGDRIPHTLELAVDGDGTTASGVVPESAGQAFATCVVTALQLDGQVTITGN